MLAALAEDALPPESLGWLLRGVLGMSPAEMIHGSGSCACVAA